MLTILGLALIWWIANVCFQLSTTAIIYSVGNPEFHVSAVRYMGNEY